MRGGAFKGPVYAVNPKHREIDGQAVFARATDLPSIPDLAVICTPAATVAGLIGELGALGTRAAVVLTAGLDAEQKRAMLAAARPHLLRILGPNCIGLLAPHIGLNASFAHTDALAGELAFVSQSGALVTAMLELPAPTTRLAEAALQHLGDSGARHAVTAVLLNFRAYDTLREVAVLLLAVFGVLAPRQAAGESAAPAAASASPVRRCWSIRAPGPEN